MHPYTKKRERYDSLDLLNHGASEWLFIVVDI